MITIFILGVNGTILEDKHKVKTNGYCSDEADKIIETIATHTWDKPQGWYMNDGRGLLIGFVY